MKNILSKILSIFLLVLFFSSCSSLKESIYNSNLQLSGERVKSLSKLFSVRIPHNWFSTIENETNSFELWLNNKEYSAAITFINIIADDQSIQEENELKNLLYYSKIVKKAELGKNYSELEYEEYFELNKIPCAAFVFVNTENQKGRIVVFEFNGRYYESTATVLNNEKIDQGNLFIMQNSILKSIY